ncbi:MAG: PRD domain-containing protein [Lachnospiraceae bacterium]|nr:PRD domain-containing protein [Lachnospiraceae bacterium]
MDNQKKPKKTKTSLSRRQKQIIQIVAQMDAKPITVAAIAEKLKVSSRTILRELPLIEDWMSENDFRFSRKTGVGLQIVESPANLELISELLEVERTTRVLGKEERRRRLLGELLFYTEPVKAFSFTSEYGISEGTLFSDLDYLEEWLDEHNVHLVRRQGVGIFIDGEEKAIRQAIVNAIFDLYDMNQIMGLLPIGKHIENIENDKDFPPLLSFMASDSRQLASRILEEFRTALNVRFKDSALVGLYIRIALAIYRMKNGRTIKVPDPEWEDLKELREYRAVKQVQEKAKEKYNWDISENEVLSVTSFLSSARIWADASFFSDPIRAINVHQFVHSMIGIVENITGLDFHGDRILVDDLVSHFSAIMDRSNKDMFLAYVQIAPIKKSYPELFSAVLTSMGILGDTISSKEVLEADVGFVTMHFAAAAERIQAESEKVVIAVVCPLGVGASRMLASSITRSFQNIEIRRTISAFEIDSEELRREGIDLIVTTTDLYTDFPYIQIGKILQTQDRLKLQNAIDEINHKRVAKKTKKTTVFVSPVGLEDIRKTANITTEIVELVENFRILQLMGVRSFQELQQQAAKLFGENDMEQQEIFQCFQKREQVNSTYIKEMGISLLHCKSTVAKHSRFGYIRLEQPLETEEGPINGGVVMIAPAHLSRDCLEPVSRLSALLIEEPAFLQALQTGDTSAGVSLVESALVKYYLNSIK